MFSLSICIHANLHLLCAGSFLYVSLFFFLTLANVLTSGVLDLRFPAICPWRLSPTIRPPSSLGPKIAFLNLLQCAFPRVPHGRTLDFLRLVCLLVEHLIIAPAAVRNFYKVSILISSLSRNLQLKASEHPPAQYKYILKDESYSFIQGLLHHLKMSTLTKYLLSMHDSTKLPTQTTYSNL